MTPPRRVVAGRRRPRPPRSTGVLAVDPDRRSTGVLLGLTLLALLVGATTAVLGVLTWTRDGAFDSPSDTPVRETSPAYVDGVGVCGAPTTVTGSWAGQGDAPAEAVTVVVLDPAGTPLARGPVDPSGSWTLPVRSLGPGRNGLLLLQDGVGPVATAPLVGC